jgi:hypothetical protein
MNVTQARREDVFILMNQASALAKDIGFIVNPEGHLFVCEDADVNDCYLLDHNTIADLEPEKIVVEGVEYTQDNSLVATRSSRMPSRYTVLAKVPEGFVQLAHFSNVTRACSFAREMSALIGCPVDENFRRFLA